MLIQLNYGKTAIPFEYDENRFQILGENLHEPSLSDIEIAEKLDNPFASPKLEDIVNAGETVLFVVPDATRQIGCGQVINLLVRRLIANGTMPFDISIIFATGIHRPVTENEKREIITPFIFQRIKTLDHNARSLSDILKIGETPGGMQIELNRALKEHDHVILIGGINFHYFAGFTGGRKLICPGLASSRTISETHKLAFDFERKKRRDGVGLGRLEGNAVHEAFSEIVGAINPSFCVNTFTNDQGEIMDLVCGDWKESHEEACRQYARQNTINISEKRDLVIVSCGGFPYDINLIQAHKALEMAAKICIDGGTIILLAECAEGLGRKDFLNWFEAENSEQLADKLCESYQVNGQTAWSLLQKAEKFNVKIVTNLEQNETHQMRLQKVRDLTDGIPTNDSKGYILPFGSKFLS